MTDEQLIQLFDLYMAGMSSEEETHQLFEYINHPANARQFTDVLGQKLDTQQGEELLPTDRRQIILEQILGQEEPPAKSVVIRRMTWLKVAAAVLVFALSGIYFLNRNKSVRDLSMAKNSTRQKDVRPGSNKAILTLSNGSKIVLNGAQNGMIARQSNATIVKLTNGQIAYNQTVAGNAAVEYNTMTTPRGGQYDLVLADGTRVWLNAASSITYPTVFTGNERRVTITGEAYFEVAKNKKMPFKVNVNGREEVEVLGTHFNIMAYDNEPVIKTTLLEGSVKINKDHTLGILKPGQQAVLTPKGQLSIIDEADVDQAVAWKNGQTLFNNEDIRTIMRQISRWYDVDVEYRGEMPARLFTGGISRESNLSEVLKVLELSKIHFTVADSKIIVTP